MTKYPASNKTSSFVRAHIKKGYYPAQLLKVEPFTDKEGKLKEGKYGRQLILEFAIFQADSESGAPVKPMQHLPNPENIDDKKDVVLSKFVYHEYLAKNPKEGESKFQTAFTPNSAITAIFKALGWTFSEEDGIDPDEYLGNWVEVNVDDYEAKDGDEKVKASTIKDIKPYEGPEPAEDLPEVESSGGPKKVDKKVKHEAVKKDSKPKEVDPEVQKEIEELEKKKENLKNLNKEGLLTDKGLKDAHEQLDAKIEDLKK